MMSPWSSGIRSRCQRAHPVAMGPIGRGDPALRRPQQSGQTLVAAPVLGRPDAAAAGQLVIVAGGPADAIKRCEPAFQVMGRKTAEAGPKPESAIAIKLANNFVLACAIEAMAEGFSLVRKYGVQPQVFYEVITEGLFAAPAYKVYGKLIVDQATTKRIHGRALLKT